MKKYLIKLLGGHTKQELADSISDAAFYREKMDEAQQAIRELNLCHAQLGVSIYKGHIDFRDNEKEVLFGRLWYDMTNAQKNKCRKAWKKKIDQARE